ncbi:hypothetical protein PHYSODRAFT_477947 [Plasmopara halstedii]|uniref:HTH CENPB-type domain-containing protein n=1 Tax=Plasmopara halstedii TaxID=4781 RepID=A0A0P1AJC2_PLAHL|nr:hypothetical protein PHYSODRAFT_477947 [Plasmopara halstedii]CEG41430.1 hypothetical protein PHYSODRAFT_477947 [Plasmopara halstedii]|eukprot:XP_024577799.1 hypothetical protein PHYSODRAFT_477947 [Plasmopara halstedii]
MSRGQRWLTLDEKRQMQVDVKRNTGIKLFRIQEWERAKFKSTFLAPYNNNDGKAILTADLLIEEARFIREGLGITDAELSLSNGWLHKFKTRHSIKFFTMHGESHSVDRVSFAVSQYELQELIAQYNSEDVFNFDKSGLFYRPPT